MRKVYSYIKEVLQYVGIIVLSIGSALWLWLTGRNKA